PLSGFKMVTGGVCSARSRRRRVTQNKQAIDHSVEVTATIATRPSRRFALSAGDMLEILPGGSASFHQVEKNRATNFEGFGRDVSRQRRPSGSDRCPDRSAAIRLHA